MNDFEKLSEKFGYAWSDFMVWCEQNKKGTFEDYDNKDPKDLFGKEKRFVGSDWEKQILLIDWLDEQDIIIDSIGFSMGPNKEFLCTIMWWDECVLIEKKTRRYKTRPEALQRIFKVALQVYENKYFKNTKIEGES